MTFDEFLKDMGMDSSAEGKAKFVKAVDEGLLDRVSQSVQNKIRALGRDLERNLDTKYNLEYYKGKMDRLDKCWQEFLAYEEAKVDIQHMPPDSYIIANLNAILDVLDSHNVSATDAIVCKAIECVSYGQWRNSMDATKEKIAGMDNNFGQKSRR